ncbi:GNAT family N-acetyltransferase [Streptomyces sp. TG1A-8]|uniref:GNAT family N-acetyltransferase n=1 Tax=Streptomyces sp. TG1A-8 TaxID=3051385 RepID=UPI00265B79F8|nr:GNAT family N-acetyltransferase [Streptomyces sp. TG1A-8]MDO0925226.1 GNAT family N-acetyltransferase [Streptomyces sp. TG1A-8]
MELTVVDLTPDQPAMMSDVAPLIRGLRPGLTALGFREFAAEAHLQGLVFTAAYDGGGRCLAVAAHRVLATSRGRLLFVDDLVTRPEARSGGVGARLMAELEARARDAGCVRIELDSGVSNHGAHRFYHARRMSIAALHFVRDLVPAGGGGAQPDRAT